MEPVEDKMPLIQVPMVNEIIEAEIKRVTPDSGAAGSVPNLAVISLREVQRQVRLAVERRGAG